MMHLLGRKSSLVETAVELKEGRLLAYVVLADTASNYADYALSLTLKGKTRLILVRFNSIKSRQCQRFHDPVLASSIGKNYTKFNKNNILIYIVLRRLQ